jgi:hypothetical protein
MLLSLSNRLTEVARLEARTCNGPVVFKGTAALNVRLFCTIGVVAFLALGGCGGGGGGGLGGGGDGSGGGGTGGGSGGGGPGGGGPPPPPVTVQYVAPADSAFVAAIDPANPGPVFLGQAGAYAGARLFTTGTIVAGSPVLANQAGYAAIYKSSDGHLYRLDLSITGAPTPRQVSSEANATTDDLCSLSGATASLGTDVNYVAEQFYNDFANPENSAYFYRLPGPDGACDTSDDVVFMVKLGMGAGDAPILARMPMAVIHNPNTGAIMGFVVNEGTALTLYDSNFQNRVVVETPAAPIGVAYALGTAQFTATGRLFLLDGTIVYVNYGNASVSAPLFTIPNWTPGKRFPTAANESTLYFSVDTSDRTQTPVTVTSALYCIPRDGSSGPVQLSTESGMIQSIAAPVGSTAVVYSVVPPHGSYTIRDVGVSGGQAPSVVTAVTTAGNSGSFVATAGYIYYTTSSFSAPDSMTRVFANTTTGIVAMDGTIVAQPVPNSRFIAQQSDRNGSGWLNVVRARNLTPVRLVSSADGLTYTEDGISGATLEVVDTSTNSVTLNLGTLPAGTIMNGTGTLTGSAGYIDGINVNSTLDPTTRELLYIDTSVPNSVQVLTSNLH